MEFMESIDEVRKRPWWFLNQHHSNKLLRSVVEDPPRRPVGATNHGLARTEFPLWYIISTEIRRQRPSWWILSEVFPSFYSSSFRRPWVRIHDLSFMGSVNPSLLCCRWQWFCHHHHATWQLTGATEVIPRESGLRRWTSIDEVSRRCEFMGS